MNSTGEGGRLPRLFHGQRIWLSAAAPNLNRTLPLDDPARWTCYCSDQQVSASTTTNAFRVVLPGGAAVYFKRYVYRRPRWRFFGRSSRAVREAVGAAAMAAVDVAGVEVLAVGEWRWFGALRAAFVVTRELPDTVDLREFALYRLPQLAPAAAHHEALAIGAAVIAQVVRLHRAGLAHRDLKWRNILIGRDASVWRCWFIDCPRFTGSTLSQRRSQLLDLSALARGAVLYLPRYTRLRLLLAYTDRDRSQARRLIRWLDAHLARRPPQHKPIAPLREQPGNPAPRPEV